MTIEVSCKILIEKDQLLKILDEYDIIHKKKEETPFFYGDDYIKLTSDDQIIDFNSSWEQYYYPEEHKKEEPEDIMPPKYWCHSDMEALRYTEEELNAMCDKAASDQEKETCREYNLREAEYYDKRVKLDTEYKKMKKWVLPTEVDGLTGDVIVNLPDDLLEVANLKEGDQVEWIDNGDGSFLLKKVEKSMTFDELTAAGWEMTGDGFWVRE